jgi:CPA2 family monovalent cation:H+ antiporter-2
VVPTAPTEAEAGAFLAAGADLVLNPYTDAAAQAADALTALADMLHGLPQWPGTLGIFRLEAESALSGQAIADLPLRRETGVTILAVIRGGTTLFDPDPGLRLSPGDRLVLLGEPEGLARSAALLAGERVRAEPPGAHPFRVAEIPLAADSPLAGRSLAEVKFRETYGVTVIGIHRDGHRLPSPSGKEILRPGDRLLVAGKADRVQQLEALGARKAVS